MVDAMDPRKRIAGARLYLVCDARPRAFLDAALRGGVDIIQLRDKALADDGYVVLLRLRSHCVPPSLRRHHPDQVRRSAACVPPSQPDRRAPVMPAS